jgi:predicted hotdog family 3-hydroxylacyl-ACP dehydratase
LELKVEMRAQVVKVEVGMVSRNSGEKRGSADVIMQGTRDLAAKFRHLLPTITVTTITKLKMSKKKELLT